MICRTLTGSFEPTEHFLRFHREIQFGGAYGDGPDVRPGTHQQIFNEIGDFFGLSDDHLEERMPLFLVGDVALQQRRRQTHDPGAWCP